MKKLLLTITTMGLLTLSGYAQGPDSAAKRRAAFSVSFEGGLPTADMSEFPNTMSGGNAVFCTSVQAELPTAQHLFFTLNAGYSAFLKESMLTAIFAPSSNGAESLKAGFKYYTSHIFYLEAGSGVAVSNKNFSHVFQSGDCAFVFASGIGFTLDSGLEFGLRYEEWASGGTISQFACRFGYRFK
ncbi:MAG TPA: hypothetical protein VFE53_12500 [Mucilaginibacter sp.]|jgi:hypothetical protein|nr:hypothetical protein [Mucilaginibacter sp.]